MRVIAGLGNPGLGYRDTRHNAGFRLADAIIQRWNLGPSVRRSGSLVAHGTVDDVPVWVVKPQTYMNRSGAALGPFLDNELFDPVSDLLVVVDEVQLPLGTFRLRGRGSPGGHNGLRSVAAALGSDDYARLRIGVGPPTRGFEDLADFVLEDFTELELEKLNSLMPTMVEAVECWLHHDIAVAMNRFNKKGNQSE